MRLPVFRSFGFVLAAVASACSSTPSSSGFAATAGSAGVSAAGGGAGGSASGTAGVAGSDGGGTLGGGAAGGGAAGSGAGAEAGGTAGAAQGGAGGAVGTGCKGAEVCYDFEECQATPTGWTVPNYPTDPGEGNQGAGSLLVDNAKAHSGKCSLHMKDFSGDQPQHALLANLPANFGPVLWGRAWVFNTAAPTEHGALIKLRYTVPNSTDVDWYEVGYEQQKYDGIWHSPLPPSGLPEWVLRSNTTIVLNAWTCVEWLFDTQNDGKTEAADPRIWQDGQEVTFQPGFEYDLTNTKGLPRPVTPKGTDFVAMEVGLTMYHAIDVPTNIYMDDLAFGKQRIGCNP